MNVATVKISAEEAAQQLEALQSRRTPADAADFYQGLEAVYRAATESRTILHLSNTFQKAGLKSNGLPKMAIARADRSLVRFHWGPSNPIAAFHCNEDGWGDASYPGLTRFVDMGKDHEDVFRTNDGRRLGYASRSAWARIPGVPPAVRPKTGQLRQWYILWEVKRWLKNRPVNAKPDVDPMLLEHLHGDFYAVLKTWDLTELEQQILADIDRFTG